MLRLQSFKFENLQLIAVTLGIHVKLYCVLIIAML